MSLNIVLVGFMGSGKSVVGKNLAVRLKRELISTDKIIEKKEKRPISQIFKESGEPYFRQVEISVVEEISRRKNVIIDCGGGVVLNDANVRNLKKNGKIFYLSATPEVIYERVGKDKSRPLLNVADPLSTIRGLLLIRKSRYELADHAINVNHKTVVQVVDEILKRYSHE